MTALAEQKQQLIARWRAEGFDEELLRAFAAVPREAFLPPELEARAYDDLPLGIGFGQTISQPTTVLTMLQLLEAQKGQKALEIGAGSGYVCALLAELGCTVTGLDIVPELAVRAARALEKLGLASLAEVHAADGSGGWEEGAPYDRILLSAGSPEVPRHLLWQLKAAGILVAPVGEVEQRMIRLRKARGGKVVEEDHGAFIFVPLTGKHGVSEEGDLPKLPFM